MEKRKDSKEAVIEVLNKARAMELLAIHQYMNQHYNLDNWDYGELAGKVKLIAIDEMRHAEMFAERVKELDGEPVTEFGGKVQKGQKVQVMFSFDAKLEDNTIDVYNQFAAVCRENGDSISMKIFETMSGCFFSHICDPIKPDSSAAKSIMMMERFGRPPAAVTLE